MWRVFAFLLLVAGVICVSGAASADCPEIPPIARTPSTGSPFIVENKGVTRLDTQTSDNVRVTGGCIDVPNLQIGDRRLQVPATCDGFSATDGAVTSVAPTAFSSASATFTAADVAKKITIYGAGAAGVALNTTIAAVVDATHVTLASGNASGGNVTGATWGFGTDYAAEINNALAAGVQLPPGKCGIASTINYSSRNRMVGFGKGTNGVPLTTLIWIGAVGGTAVSSGDPSGAISGITLGEFNIDGLCSAATGLKIHGVNGSRFLSGIVSNATSIGIDEDTTPGGVTTQDNDFWLSADGSGCGGTAKAWVIGAGTASSNVNHNRYYSTRVVHKDGAGLEINNADSEMFYGFWGQRTGGGGLSLDLKGSNTALVNARSIYFFGAEPQGGTTVRGTGLSVPAANINIWLNKESGAPNPTIETGATVMCVTNKGAICGNLGGEAYAQFTPADQSISTTGQRNMLGLGATATFTPRTSGTVEIEVTGSIQGTGTTNSVNHIIEVGTGSAPANGTDTTTISPTPTSAGSTPSYKPAAAASPVPFVLKGRATGLTLGTTYWIDIGAQPFAGVGTVTYGGLTVTVREIR